MVDYEVLGCIFPYKCSTQGWPVGVPIYTVSNSFNQLIISPQAGLKSFISPITSETETSSQLFK